MNGLNQNIMIRKTITIAMVFMFSMLPFGCSDFLDQTPDRILTNEEIFSDQNMINAVLANFYGRLDWGQRLSDEGSDFAHLDEACFSGSGGPDNRRDYGDDWWRVYDYTLIRDINQFLQGVKSAAAAELTPATRNQIEGEARFIRAWTYFNMCRGMGGMPIVDDQVFEYKPGTDVTTLQIPRATEAGLYNYIISECTEIARLLPDDPSKNTHAARANKWAALTLKARAALYAGSIAKYNNLVTPNIKTANGEVGIPADMADHYYSIALATADSIIMEGKYSLYKLSPDQGKNFYNALANKGNNPEVIWALDYFYPGGTTQFTAKNLPTSVKVDIDANRVTPILNLVEAFEYKNDRNGKLKDRDANGDYIYYENIADIFNDKDPRLYGTIIYPGADFRGVTITYQAGQKYLDNGEWKNRTGNVGSKDGNGDIITDINGPITGSDQHENKAGFNIRKFIDENRDAATRGRGSEMWFVRMRYAEVLMIAAESAMELGKDQGTVCGYINQVRNRAGIQPLTNVTLDDVVNERRVEFAFENHRWWDLKRWRKAHILWNGVDNSPTATHYVLFPYKINQPDNPNHGKWVFDRQKASMSLFPRYFRMQNYYNFLDQDWLNKNPKMVKNPYQ